MTHKSGHVIIDAHSRGQIKKLPEDVQKEIEAIVDRANEDVEKLMESVDDD